MTATRGSLAYICVRWRLFCGLRRQIGLFMLLLHVVNMVGGQIRYSIPEEMKKGSVIGNVAQDLGLDLRRLRSGRARIVTGENIHYTELKTDKGILVVNERIDREQLCGDVTPCSFSFEVILENPMELHRVTVEDGGSPPLSSNVSVKILIQDQNDNPPQVLYPVQTGGSVVAEMVPRSADVGYLVTKVVAVDVDSGQNAWLSYKLQKATDRALFEVGLQNGEIRTIRQVTDKDAVKQRLSVIVEDNGQPSRSATVIVNVAVADSFPEVLSEFTDFPHDKEYNDNLTFYLVLALAVVSFLFITCLVVIISVKIYRWRQSRILYHSSLPVIPYYPPRYSDTLGTGTLQHVYNYEVCRTTDSRKSDCKFGRAGSQNVLIMDPSSTGTMQRIQSDKSILDEPDSPLERASPNIDRSRVVFCGGFVYPSCTGMILQIQSEKSMSQTVIWKLTEYSLRQCFVLQYHGQHPSQFASPNRSFALVRIFIGLAVETT
ncbi:hypothetical protein ABVT39_023740 [Epinephelus coioides]